MPSSVRSPSRHAQRQQTPVERSSRPRSAERTLPGHYRARRSRPLSQPEPSGDSRRRPARDGAPSVLVVDDESAIRMICRVNLESAGMTVLEAADGAEALELARKERPALVLLDVMMPNVDGWKVAEQLTAERDTRDIPVVFLTARAGKDDRLQAHRLGAVGYVVKPFDPLELGSMLQDVLDRVKRGERERLRDELAEGA